MQKKTTSSFLFFVIIILICLSFKIKADENFSFSNAYKKALSNSNIIKKNEFLLNSKTNLISKTNIGDFVQSGLENFKKLKEIENGNNLYLTFRDPIRVIVEKHHINNGGMNFYSLIQKIKIYIQ